MTTKILTYPDKASAIAKIREIERDLGYPVEGVRHGDGNHCPPELGRTVRYCDPVESADGLSWGVSLIPDAEKVLRAPEKAAVQTVDLHTYRKNPTPFEAAIAIAQAEEVIK